MECWEVSGTVDYVARFVCADLAAYEELTTALIDDENLGVARVRQPCGVAPRVRRFAAIPYRCCMSNVRRRRLRQPLTANRPHRTLTPAARAAANT